MLENPPPATDAAGSDRPAGAGAWGGFDAARFSASDVAEIERGVADARAWCRKAGLGEGRNGDWIYQAHDTGDFGQDYDYRARIALSGLAALPETEAMYLTALDPAGSPYFDATQAWRLHFPTNSLPPVDAFWSLTRGVGRWSLLPDRQFSEPLCHWRSHTDAEPRFGRIAGHCNPAGRTWWGAQWQLAACPGRRGAFHTADACLSAWQADDRPAICPPAGIARLNRAGASSLGLQLQPTRRSDTGITALI
jgi:hypothetical protein